MARYELEENYGEFVDTQANDKTVDDSVVVTYMNELESTIESLREQEDVWHKDGMGYSEMWELLQVADMVIDPDKVGMVEHVAWLINEVFRLRAENDKLTADGERLDKLEGKTILAVGAGIQVDLEFAVLEWHGEQPLREFIDSIPAFDSDREVDECPISHA